MIISAALQALLQPISPASALQEAKVPSGFPDLASVFITALGAPASGDAPPAAPAAPKEAAHDGEGATEDAMRETLAAAGAAAALLVAPAAPIHPAPAIAVTQAPIETIERVVPRSTDAPSEPVVTAPPKSPRCHPGPPAVVSSEAGGAAPATAGSAPPTAAVPDALPATLPAEDMSTDPPLEAADPARSAPAARHSPSPRADVPIPEVSAEAARALPGTAGKTSALAESGREPGRRGSDGVVATRTGGADPSAPSSLPAASARAEAPEARALPPRPAPPVHDLAHLEDPRPAPREGGALRLEVAHDTLGPIELRIAVRDDVVHATLYASHDHAREALAAHRPELEAALGRSHLRLEGFNVGLGQHRENEPREPRPALSAPPVAAAREPRPLETAALAGGLSVRA